MNLIIALKKYVLLQSGTVLPDPGISATDPEGATVSFSIDCGSDSGYLTMDSASGLVTMTTAFDLEAESVNRYIIRCKVIATDATGEMSNATLNVDVTDGNDLAPVFESTSYEFYIVEGKQVCF